jgi:ubiquinone/menaquinone biosynthesis C-methylase UbiE
MPISELKTNAWQSKETAELYHVRTAGAHRLFQTIRHELFLRYIQRYANRGMKVLDLGSGSGLLSVALSDLGYEVVACDVSQAMLDKLASEKGNRKIELRLGNGFKIPAAEEEFDLVVSRMFLQHFPDWPAILKEKARVTRAGGAILFDFGNREHVTAASNPRIIEEFPYDAETDVPTKYYAVATEEEMRRTAAACGLSVMAIIPHGLMLNNAHLWNALGRQGVEDFYNKLDHLLEDEQARQLLLFIEESFVSLVPKELTYGNVTVLRKVPSS